jgi:hypothetical protein
MPEDTLSQEEGDHRFRTFLNLPGFCQFSNKVLKISIILNQSVENEAVDVTGGRILGKNGIEKRGVPNRTDNQLVDFLGRFGTNEDNIDPQENKKKNGRDKENGLDLQRGFPFK